MDPNLKGKVPGVWEQFYEAAITEPDRTKRMERLIEAQRAVLERALVLEKEGGNNPAEGQALQEAADFLREMKLSTLADGLGKELTAGDKGKRQTKTRLTN